MPETEYLISGLESGKTTNEAKGASTRNVGFAPVLSLGRKKKRRITVQISNPIEAGRTTTSLFNALREVERGNARLEPGEIVGSLYTGKITFVDHSVEISADQALLARTRSGYDMSVSQQIEARIEQAMAGVPIVQPAVALNRGKRTAGCGPLHRH
jgi:hypothetical protein